jgi:uncharacterized repeat protein (TIGR03803 family)
LRALSALLKESALSQQHLATGNLGKLADMRTGKRLVQGLVIGISMFICMLSGLANPSDTQAAYTILHNFTDGATDGLNPFGSLTLTGSTLYGMTSDEDASGGNGGVLQMNTDGTGAKVLHAFGGKPSDGALPLGSLTLVGSKLYGMATGGGKADGPGVIFSINLDGSGYQVILKFADVPYLVGGPYGSLNFSGGKLYGMTHGGGPYTGGVVFQINPDGSGYQPPHYFNSFTGDGTGPYGDVTPVGSKLYGMTYGGGSHGSGVIFSCQRPWLDSGMLQLLLLR